MGSFQESVGLTGNKFSPGHKNSCKGMCFVIYYSGYFFHTHPYFVPGRTRETRWNWLQRREGRLENIISYFIML